MILLFCSQGRSMCFDHAGNSYISDPSIFSLIDGEKSPCHCPCDEDDCEEHELKLDPMMGDSVSVPPIPYVFLPLERPLFNSFDRSFLFADQTCGQLLVSDDPVHVFHLRKTLMSGVVLRL